MPCLGDGVNVAQVGRNAFGVGNVVDGNLRGLGWAVGELEQHGERLANATGAAEDRDLHVLLRNGKSKWWCCGCS
jgi:hypothetical protein